MASTLKVAIMSFHFLLHCLPSFPIAKQNCSNSRKDFEEKKLFFFTHRQQHFHNYYQGLPFTVQRAHRNEGEYFYF